MSFHSLIVAAPQSLSTSGLVSYLQGLFGPLFQFGRRFLPHCEPIAIEVTDQLGDALQIRGRG